MSDQIEQVVTVERASEHVVLVTLQRPDARNAINAAVTARMRDIVRETEADPSIWAVVLTGAGGKAFCAGADLKEVSEGGIAGLIDSDAGFASFVHASRSKLWIAAVNGFAMAGGCEISLACDMIVASHDAQFALPEVKRGLIAAAGGLFRLPRRIPRAIAFEMIATGDPITAERALALGLVNCVVAKDDTVTAALALAEKVCQNAPIAVRESLGVARRAIDDTEEALDSLSNAAQDRVMLTADFAEGPKAFVEKRPPNWVGR